MKKWILYFPIVLACTLVVGMFVGSRMDFPARPVSMLDEVRKEQKIRQIINYIDYEYVDQVNTDSLLDLTIRDMLHRLDPHSTYIAQSEVRQTQESIRGNFDGVGIEYQVRNDTLVIIRALPTGPAEKAGLKGGDRILAIDGESVVGNLPETQPVIDRMRGPSGTKVTLDVLRSGSSGSKTYQLVRKSIPLISMDVAYMLNDTVGIIKINRFSETTGSELESGVRRLQRSGMNTLILDLRDNPGGLLSAARKMSDVFLPAGNLIVYTQDREGEKDMSYATSRGSFIEGHLAVLVNENSASAAEIVAGALQDNDRAIIVGRRTFGKGLVQEEMRLSDGSRVRLTTARYFTPTGRSIQKPYDQGYEVYQREAAERVKNGEFFQPDSTLRDPKNKYITPKGKVVYGGGGITPDVFVPVDSSVYTSGWLYHQFSYARVNNFAFEWVDRHRRELENMSPQDFIDNWEVSDELYLELIAAIGATAYEKRIDDVMKRFVLHRLKALVGRNVWGESVFYPIFYGKDPMVEAALRALAPPMQEVEEEPEAVSEDMESRF